MNLFVAEISEKLDISTAAKLIAVKIQTLLERHLTWLDTHQEEFDTATAAWPVGSEIDREKALEHRLEGPEGRAWCRLVELFRLSEAEAELLEVALAVAIEPAIGPLVGRAQGTGGRLVPTEPLVKKLFGHPAKPIWRPTSPLAMWGLVKAVKYTPGEALGFEADARIVDWLYGTLSLDASLVLGIDTTRTGPVPPEWPVRQAAARLDAALRANSEVRLVIKARAGAGRRIFAAAVAQKLGREALIVDPAPLAPDDWAENFMRVQRLALYAEVALIWREGAPAWPGKIPLAPLQLICVDEGENAPVRDSATDLMVKLPEPSVATKAGIWQSLMPHLAGDAEELAATPGLSLGDLEEASNAAPRTTAEAGAFLRAKARARIQGAGRIVDPRFGWNDFVARPDLINKLQRIVFEARMWPSLLENPETARLFAGMAGISALFSGPPGVGKSMAAQVIARDLGVNLLVVDLAATTSKYIGETAKNLTRVFIRAHATGAALIFEEADAFFARRTDVKDSNDRHANSDTNHLLQLLEVHSGLVILSTNRRANIDPAFTRRLRHVVEFPKPGPAERRQLWILMLTALDIDPTPLLEAIDLLAENHDLSPAQIKGATLSARFTALAANRPVSAEDLEGGAAHELSKEGRSIPPRVNPKNRRKRSRING